MQVLAAAILLLSAVAAQSSQIFEPLNRTPKPKPPQKTPNQPCGIRKVNTRALIVGGAEIVHGEWPWHAAVYYLLGGGRIREYMCGGTLIRNDFVLTTASCARHGVNKTKVAIVIELGQYNLVESSSQKVSVPVSKVYIYDKDGLTRRRNDVGLLRLKNKISYNDYIQPACLPKPGERIDQYDDKLGTIVGWGFEQAGKLSERLRSARVPVVSYIDCLLSDREFFGAKLNDGMFCAGFTNGTAPCFGDAGGGMFFLGGDGAWTLRGIISFTHVVYTVTGGCNTEHFFGLTNVVTYLPWINETINGGDRVPTVSQAPTQQHSSL